MSRYICPLCSNPHLRLSDMSPTIESIYREVDDLVDDCNCQEAYKKLVSMCDFVNDKAEWHRKCAEVCYMVSNMEEKDQERVEWLKTGRQHALDAHELNPVSVPILKILCSTTGRLAEESGIREKISLGFEFKTYLDRAVALDPLSFELLHMRGRFQYQVANLSFFERLAARAIGTLPPTSLDSALTDLLELRFSSCDYITAKKWLAQAASASCDEDEPVEREHIEAARELLLSRVYQK
ncbi:unnamed protein product [Cylicocyclus nassatus]|uniref:Uncharacterized protein n=2 Tax=Cylicocyclus nassatus TaxID=53992 RepID=A0AA36DMX3_CYLNA|nr:unnamed protein product [Cylicocyclus nassatus]